MPFLLLLMPRAFSSVRKYLLNGTNIKPPTSFEENNSYSQSLQRTLSGNIYRDLFNLNKRIWNLEFDLLSKSDYDVIASQYEQNLRDETPISWRVIQPNYTVVSTLVHVYFKSRGFTIRGSDYISNLEVELVEA